VGKKPIIGVTPMYDYEKNMTFIRQGYMESILEAGGLPILLPAESDTGAMMELMDMCDGFLLPGGPDVDARLYGENNLSFTDDISPVRDSIEVFVARKAVECNKPLLGICRGIQIINAAFGGTLYQDIKSQATGREVLKHFQNAPRWYPIHEVYIKQDSIIRRIYGKDTISVNSFHHQAVKGVANGFAATSESPDGIIESIEHRNHKFAVGVQWHAELMWQKDRLHLRLFEEFVRAAGD